MIHVSYIKLIRTDTTLDLNKNAEKGMTLNSLGLRSRYGIWTMSEGTFSLLWTKLV
ncbi:hypothetical protein ES332_A10G092400v1 [Gossypium tomentosum]|uniref:Uncharacterized protein n=1 Tax=Gossypium tomentosum TaxID=34277 RepID=A0A5D2NMT1_GOSTO|nr:hypothetical protein ES332_A10G092400v1 [Gossypium tomentosum]